MKLVPLKNRKKSHQSDVGLAKDMKLTLVQYVGNVSFLWKLLLEGTYTVASFLYFQMEINVSNYVQYGQVVARLMDMA